MSAAKVRQNEEMDNIRVQFVSLYVGKHNSLEYLCTGHSQDVYPKHENDVPLFYKKYWRNIWKYQENFLYLCTESLTKNVFIMALLISEKE